MQLRTHQHGPRTRPRHPGPRSLTTPQSRRRAASASRAGPSVAGLGLQPGERTLRAEAPLSAAPSPAGLAGYSAERTKQERPSARRGPDHFRAAASAPPTMPVRGHSFETPALHRQAAVPTAGREARLHHDAPRQAWRETPEAWMGLDSSTYIFPPPRPPPALLSR